MISPLPEIRAALTDERLSQAMTARQPQHLAGALGEAADFWRLSDLEAALARGAVPASQLSMFLGDRAMDLDALGIAEAGRLRPLALGALSRQGATLVINNLQQQFPQLWRLACDAERWLGDTVTVGAVASFGPSNLKLHYDSEDLIILQLAGAKLWRFHGEAVPDNAIRRVPSVEAEHALTGEVLMRTGDIMYVPCGLRHRCEPQGDSLHMGLLVEHASGRDFTAHFAQVVRDDPLLNAPFQRFLGADVAARQARAVKARLAALLEASDPLAWLDERAASRTRVSGIGFHPASAGAASLALSAGPVRMPDGKWRAAEQRIDSTPEVDALIAALTEGPKPSVELPADALAMLVAKGIVRIEP